MTIHLRGTWRAGLAMLAGLFLCTCSTSPTLHTTQLRGDVASPIAGGVTYYLPKRVLKLGVWETTEVVIETNKEREEVYTEGETRTFGTILEIQTIPDRNYLMRLSHDPSASFHDNVAIGIDPDGLLRRVATTTVDEGPAIVAKLAELATLVAQAPTAYRGPREKGVVGSRRYELRTRLLRTLIVNPTDASSYQMQLAQYGIVLQATPMLAGADGCCTIDEERPCEPVCSESGVCYRPVVPYHVALRPGGLLSAGTAIELQDGTEDIVLLPNRSPIVCLPIDRTPFVTSSFVATFDHGLLTSVESDKPSEILGFLEIPIRVAKAVVGIPGELLTFRVNHYERLQKAAGSEAAALQAIENLSKARQGE